MRYEGVLRATTSAALICGLVLVLTGCGRAMSRVGPSPSAEISSSPAVESPATTSPSADTTGSTPPATASSLPTNVPSTAPPLSIGSLTLPAGEVGITYPAVALGASGGRPPYSWSISSGSLPIGLTLSASSVSGTPSIAGPFSFTVQVADSGGGTAGVGKSVTIAASLAVSGSCTTQCSVEEGCVTVCGTVGSQSGGIAPYTYALTGGALPSGMSLNGLSLAGPFPRGQRSVTGAPIPYKLTVKVTDALGAQGSVDATFNVFAHLAFAINSAKCPSAIRGCSMQLTYTGGTPGIDPKVNVIKVSAPNYKDALPTGFNAYTKGGVLFIVIPAQPNGWSGTITLSLVDQSPCGPGYTCSSSNLGTVTA